MTPPEWVNAIIAHTRVLASASEISPIAFIAKGDSVFIIPSATIPIKDHDQAKEVFAALVRRAAIEKAADHVLMVSEAWVRQGDPGETADNVTSGRISEHPNRKDAIVMSLESMKGSWMAVSHLEGMMGSRTFGPIEFQDTSVSGRMSNFLPDKDA